MKLRIGLLVFWSGCALVTAACTSGTASEPSKTGGADSGSTGNPPETTDPLGDSGAAGEGPALPAGTLLYLRAETKGNDLLVARDLESGVERVVTDLKGDGSSGWDIWGYALSPDRRRIAIASLYGPTSEDTATGLATRAIWTLATDGTDFHRLTPTFPNTSGGRSGFQISVSNPMWNADGSRLLFDMGTYWTEAATLKGGTLPWSVSASGDAPPTTWPTSQPCSVLRPSRNPVTGEMLLIHSVCIPGSGADGLYLYPAEGGSNPQMLVASAHVSGSVDVYLETPSWISDGSGFLFVGSTEETNWTPGVFLYDMAEGTTTLVIAPPPDGSIDSVTIAPDGSKLVYTLRKGEEVITYDLHGIDLTASPLTDVAITTDGKSRRPWF